MTKYIKVYRQLIINNLSWLIAYRSNFINSMISSLVWGTISLLSMYLLSAGSASIYGWNQNQLLLMVGVYNIIVGTFHVLFSRNFERFSRIVNLGELDGVLLKPIDSQFLMSFWVTNFTGIFRIVLGIVFSSFILQKLHISLNVVDVVVFMCLMIFSITFLYGIWFIIITLTIWYTNLSNLVGLLYEVNGTTRFPAEMFIELGSFIVLIFVPLTFVINTPTKVLLQKFTTYEMVIVLICSGGLFLLSRWFWKFALRHYTSAS